MVVIKRRSTVYRDDGGRIDIAFSRSADDIPILVTECMIIRIRIRLVRSRKIRNINMESDALQVVQAINRETS